MKRDSLEQPSCRPGESRCQHDMLIFGERSTCGFCLGLPDYHELVGAEAVPS